MRRPFVEKDTFMGDLLNLLTLRPVYRTKKDSQQKEEQQ